MRRTNGEYSTSGGMGTVQQSEQSQLAKPLLSGIHTQKHQLLPTMSFLHLDALTLSKWLLRP